MAAAVERGPAERLQFLDAVRGFALLLMIVNHTGRWWQDGAMGLLGALGAGLFSALAFSTASLWPATAFS